MVSLKLRQRLAIVYYFADFLNDIFIVRMTGKKTTLHSYGEHAVQVVAGVNAEGNKRL